MGTCDSKKNKFKTTRNYDTIPNNYMEKPTTNNFNKGQNYYMENPMTNNFNTGQYNYMGNALTNNRNYQYNNNPKMNTKKVYDYQYYKDNYTSPKPYNQLQNKLPNPMKKNHENIYMNNQYNNNNNKMYSEIIKLEQKFKNIKNANKVYYKDIKKQKEFINNYKTFVNELNHELNNLQDQLYISVYDNQLLEDNLIVQNEKEQLIKNLEELSYKINQLNSILYTQKKDLKNLEINYKIIQEKINEIKQNEYSYDDYQNNDMLLLMNKDIISNYLYELEGISRTLAKNKNLYDRTKYEIEKDIKRIQNLTEQKVNQIKAKRKSSLQKSNLPFYQNRNNQINDSLFLKGSMLLGIKDFSNAKDIFNSIYLFQEKDDNNYDKEDLIKKNWNEICCIYDDYDIIDVKYELKAVGLPENSYFTRTSFGFYLDYDIDILEFEMDGEKSKYNLENHSLRFKIKLKNLQSCKIHLKYKQSPILSKLTEGEMKQKDISKLNVYGLSNRLAGQTAKYTLKNLSNFEIINFDKDFFIKTNENEYTWGGCVPKEGRKAVVRLSKSEGRYKFYEKHIIKNMNKHPIKNTTLKIPYCYMYGNNQLNKFSCKSKQTTRIKMDEIKKTIFVQYLNTQSYVGELEIKVEIINRCKGEWICNFTDAEIESFIPEDCKYNKKQFNEIANGIIREYDEMHRNELAKIHDVAKVGKWVHDNMQYNIDYSGRNDINATETYNNLEGVCDHFTKLYNALVYSLGYKVLYLIGYALDSNDAYGTENGHAWSLIKIEGKWLPFDATWGIFSGKLPVSHVFRSYGSSGIVMKGYDACINYEKAIVNGKFIK